MSFWPEPANLEGRAEIYLRWKNLAMIAMVMLVPLLVALFFASLIVKSVCWVFALLAYMSYKPVQGPCVLASAIAILPWYVYFEWSSSPKWVAALAAVISLIEYSYIRHRMKFITGVRKKEGVLL